MAPSSRAASLAPWPLAAMLLLLPGTLAQPRAPRIGYVFPAGGQRGTTFEVTLGGQYLDGVTNAWCSGAGVQARVVAHTKPLTPRQTLELREKAQALQTRKTAAARRPEGAVPPPESTNVVWTVADERMLADLRAQLAASQRRSSIPALAETVTLEVTVPPDAGSGDRELRLETANGLSNPLRFDVGTLAEYREQEAPTSTAPRESRVTPPLVMNGQIMPGDVDRYRFTARPGQRVVALAQARALIPYLADAVPGWFQATLTLYDDTGREVAYADDYRHDPDPVLEFAIPRDGDYVLEIKDALYRGREDFVYRIALGELPFVTSVFPLGAQLGVPRTVTLAGWNLPTNRLRAPVETEGLHRLAVAQGSTESNPVGFAIDALPEFVEPDPTPSPPNPPEVTLPVIVNGRVGRPGEWDAFRFEARAGEAFVADVMARRLGSPLDAVLELLDPAGRRWATNDDGDDQGAGLDTHHADSRLHMTLPRSGTWYVRLGDAQGRGGEEYAYRLRLSPPRPDFALRLVPSTLSAQGGTSVPFTVHALRTDGFSGAIALGLERPPPGFALSGARVPAGQDRIRLTLTLPSVPPEAPVNLTLVGRAQINAREVVRTAVPADDLMQAFAYRHLVPAREFKVAVTRRAPARNAPRIVGPSPLRIPSGGTASLRVGLPANLPGRQVAIELNDPPDGLVIDAVYPRPLGVELHFRSDAAKLEPGLEGNLILEAFAMRSGPVRTNPPPANRRRQPLATFPAVPFIVVTR